MASTARQVVFGERLELKWPGSRLSSSCKAIVLGDIDNDGVRAREAAACSRPRLTDGALSRAAHRPTS